MTESNGAESNGAHSDGAENTGAETAAAQPKREYGWPAITVAILFGVLYAYDLWEAISNLVELPRFYDRLGLDPSSVPWLVLLLGVALPPVAFGIAYFVGLRHNLFGKAVTFAVGLAVVAALSLTLVAFGAVL